LQLREQLQINKTSTAIGHFLYTNYKTRID
jgi:hypothetical protein